MSERTHKKNNWSSTTAPQQDSVLKLRRFSTKDDKDEEIQQSPDTNLSKFSLSTNSPFPDSNIQRQEIEEEKEREEKPEINLQSDEPPTEESENENKSGEEDSLVNLKSDLLSTESSEEENKNLESNSIQTKLTIGKPGDKYEQEADATAAKVMAMSNKESEEIYTQSGTNVATKPKVLRYSSSSLQAKANKISTSSSLESRLGSSKGGGSPLSDSVRGFMEPRFGADFSNVRVHSDSSAVQMNKQLGAQAFAHGSDIYYGAGKSPGNNELTAHELTHTIQQTGGVALQKPSQVKEIGEDKQSQSPIEKPQEKSLEAKQVGNNNTSTANSNKETSQTIKNKTEKESLNAKKISKGSKKVEPKQNLQVEAKVNQPTVENVSQNPTEATTSTVTNNVIKTPITAGGNAETAINAGQESAPVPQEAAPIVAEKPGQILEQLKNTPPTQAVSSYTQAQTASAQALEKQKQQLQETIPEIPAPTGLPAKESEPQKAGGIAEQAAITKQAPDDKLGATKSGENKAKYDTSVPESPPAPPITATQLAGGKVEQEGQSDQALSKSAQNSLASVSLNTSQINTRAGDVPSVDLTGEADPSQINATQAKSTQQVQATKAQAAQGITQDFGENSISPKASNETLKANKELSAVAAPGGKGGETPALSGEVVGGLNQSLSPFLREKIGVEQEKYQSGKDKFDTDSAKARTDADQEIGQLTDETKQKQLEKRQLAQTEVAAAKQEWQTELDNAELDYQQKAGKATQEQQQKIGQEKTKGETQAAKHLVEAEQKAEAEKQKADNEAAKKKEEGKKESGGFWGWAKSAAKTLIDGVKQAVNFVYDNLRKAVKAIFEAAKQLAMAAIDLASNVIVGLIKAYGEILKGLVRVVFAAFPGIAKKITAKIDRAVNKAEQAINAAADLLKKGISAVLDFLANTLDAILAAYQAMYNAILDAVGAVIDAVFDVMQKIGNLVSAAQQMPEHFWGQMSEEVLGMDVTQPLPFERTPEDCAQCNVPGTTEGTPLATEGENSQLAQMLSKDEFTEDDIAVDGVAPFNVSPEFLTSLNLQDGGEVEFGESNNPANSMEAIKAELAGEANSEQATAPQTVSGGETAEPGACCDNEATAQAKLEKMMSQKVEGAESTQKQGQPDKQGDIPANMRTIGPLTPGQRASYMFNQLKQGIQQWFAANWGKLLAGAIAGITGFIAANILTGGAVMAAVPPLLQILGTVMAGVGMAQIAGHIGYYFSQGWAGETAVAAKSLARGVAAGAIELVFALLFNAGAIFKALKGGIKGATKAAVTSVKTTVKATAKSAKELVKIGAKGAKTAFKNGKIMVKGLKGGFTKGAKSIDDLAQRLKNKLRFNKFKIHRQGRRIQLLGHLNPWILLADGRVEYIDRSNLKGKQVGDILDDAGDITKGLDDKRGIIIGWQGEEIAGTSKYVKAIESGSDDAKELFNRLSSLEKKQILSRIGRGDKSTYELRKGIAESLGKKKEHLPKNYQAHHIIPEELQGNNKIKSFLDDLSFGFQDGKRNGVLLPGNTPRQKGWENATPHIGSHPKYTNKVQRFLETASDAYYKELKAGADVTQTKEFFNAKLDRYLNSVKKGLMDGKVILNYK